MAIFHEVLRKEMKLRELIEQFQCDFNKTGIQNGVILCESFGNNVKYTMFGKKARIERNFKDIDADIITRFFLSFGKMEMIKENNCRIQYYTF